MLCRLGYHMTLKHMTLRNVVFPKHFSLCNIYLGQGEATGVLASLSDLSFR